MPVNRIASYLKLVENINVKLNGAARVNVDAERTMNETLKKLDTDAKAQRKHAADQRESVKNDYQRMAKSLESGSYAVINVRIPAAVRPLPSDVDPQMLAAKQHNLVVQIRSLSEMYLRQKLEEDETRKREAEARRRQAEAAAAAAARARAAAAAALARRQALLNQRKPEPSKKKPNVALIVGIVVSVVAIIGIAVAVAVLM